MKPAMLDLSKWKEKTAQLVRRFCDKHPDKLPVGVSVIFYDALAEEDQWGYEAALAYSTEEELDPVMKKKLEMVQRFLAVAVKRIYHMSVEELDELSIH